MQAGVGLLGFDFIECGFFVQAYVLPSGDDGGFPFSAAMAKMVSIDSGFRSRWTSRFKFNVPARTDIPSD